MALLRILPDVTGSRYFKMAVAKPDILLYQLPDNIATPFQRLTPNFGVQLPNVIIANSALCNRKSVFQDGGLQNGRTYKSVSRQDSNAVPTATPHPHFRGQATA